MPGRQWTRSGQTGRYRKLRGQYPFADRKPTRGIRNEIGRDCLGSQKRQLEKMIVRKVEGRGKYTDGGDRGEDTVADGGLYR